jgi:hypothetical protein
MPAEDNSPAAPDDTSLDLLEVVDDFGTIRLLLGAAHMAATSDAIPSELHGLATLIDVIEGKLTDAVAKLDSVRLSKEVANV